MKKIKKIILLASLLISMSLLLSLDAYAQLFIDSYTPEATAVPAGSYYYVVNNLISHDNVTLVWNFTKGLDAKFVQDISNISLKEKGSSTEITFDISPGTQTTPAPGYESDPSSLLIQNADFAYLKAGGGTDPIQYRRLTLKPTTVTFQPSKTYVITIDNATFQANNNNILQHVYSFEFQTETITSSSSTSSSSNSTTSVATTTTTVGGSTTSSAASTSSVATTTVPASSSSSSTTPSSTTTTVGESTTSSAASTSSVATTTVPASSSSSSTAPSTSTSAVTTSTASTSTTTTVDNCPLRHLLGDSKQEELNFYRQYRGALCRRSAMGAFFVGLYYMHGQELVAIINDHQELNRQGRTLLLALAPTIKKALARGGPLKISQKQLSAFTNLAAGVKAHASPALAKTTATIEWALNDEQMMRCFNISIERK